MHEAILYDKLPNSRVRCNICQWYCVIGSGKYGVCRVRYNVDGVLQLVNYAQVSSLAADPIEKKPLYHFFPGTSCLSLGTIGCNFHCIHCQNWEIACIDDVTAFNRGLSLVSAEESINIARQYQCEGIAWTYNEPTVWFEYTLDSAKLAKKNRLYTVYVTNGYITLEALDIIAPYLDAWRVDVKGFSDSAYRQLTRIKNWRGILEIARRAKQKWNMHIEVVTNIIPNLNDDDDQLKNLAEWIVNDLGELTPWHVTRFYPHRNLTNIPATPIATLEKAYEIGKQAGLKFVYLGNVPGHDKENTICYNCGNIVIKRMGYNTEITGIANGRCHFCGIDLNIRMTL